MRLMAANDTAGIQKTNELVNPERYVNLPVRYKHHATCTNTDHHLRHAHTDSGTQGSRAIAHR